MTKISKKQYKQAYDKYIEARDEFWEIRDKLQKPESKIAQARAIVRKLLDAKDSSNNNN